MAYIRINNSGQPQVSYQCLDGEANDDDRLNSAFDILFNEIAKQNNDLTAIDN